MGLYADHLDLEDLFCLVLFRDGASLREKQS